jgi:hypothetical protein
MTDGLSLVCFFFYIVYYPNLLDLSPYRYPMFFLDFVIMVSSTIGNLSGFLLNCSFRVKTSFYNTILYFVFCETFGFYFAKFRIVKHAKFCEKL